MPVASPWSFLIYPRQVATSNEFFFSRLKSPHTTRALRLWQPQSPTPLQEGRGDPGNYRCHLTARHSCDNRFLRKSSNMECLGVRSCKVQPPRRFCWIYWDVIMIVTVIVIVIVIVIQPVGSRAQEMDSVEG